MALEISFHDRLLLGLKGAARKQSGTKRQECGGGSCPLSGLYSEILMQSTTATLYFFGLREFQDGSHLGSDC